jgi:hypothetical protein
MFCFVTCGCCTHVLFCDVWLLRAELRHQRSAALCLPSAFSHARTQRKRLLRSRPHLQLLLKQHRVNREARAGLLLLRISGRE